MATEFKRGRKAAEFKRGRKSLREDERSGRLKTAATDITLLRLKYGTRRLLNENK